jgi:uncharacterized protein YjiS (DUF1127 family)
MKHTNMIKYYLQQVHQLMIRQRTRRQLLELDEAALYDVGITRSQAIKEGSKPFWKSADKTASVEKGHSVGRDTSSQIIRTA